MLRFETLAAAVSGVRELMGRVVQEGLPAIHAGVAAGSFVVRDGDVFGHTVNVASRLAAIAAAGELVVARESGDALDRAGIEWQDGGEVELKGVNRPVRVARVAV